VRPGDSGGGVLNAAGQLVGVVWGQRDGLTYATCGRPVREFLERIGRREPKHQPPASRGVPAPGPDSNALLASIDSRLSQIESRITTLDANKQDKGDYVTQSDLNGYVRVDDIPQFDQSQFARRTELDGRIESLSTRFKSVQSRIESVEQHVHQVVAGGAGFTQGLSFGKLLAAALGLSGPLAAAVILASTLAGRRVKKRLTAHREVEPPAARTSTTNDADRAPQRRPRPIAIDSPPPPQQTVPETHYVPFEKDSFAKAHQWASEQVARKYPGATEVLQAQDSLIKQFLNAT
jgi:hypothetical protein